MINIVTHCYAVALPQYAAHLNYQLSSLVLHKCDVPVRITVCLNYEDHRTIEVVNWFRDNHPELDLHTIQLSKAKLFKRAIGRNLAINTDFELHWFTDVDHVFGAGCLNCLWLTWLNVKTQYKHVSLMYPKEIKIHETHKLGDIAADLVIEPGLHQVDPNQFITKYYNRAIGGCQISPKWYMQDFGYLRDDVNHQRELEDTSKPFPSFRDDVGFRAGCQANGRILPIALPSLFRIRHSETSYQGASA